MLTLGAKPLQAPAQHVSIGLKTSLPRGCSFTACTSVLVLTHAWHTVQGKTATEVVTLRNNGLLPAIARISMEAHAAFKLQDGSCTVSLQSKQAQQLVLEFAAAEVKQHTHEVSMLEGPGGQQLMLACALHHRPYIAQVVQHAHMCAVWQRSEASTAGIPASCVEVQAARCMLCPTCQDAAALYWTQSSTCLACNTCC